MLAFGNDYRVSDIFSNGVKFSRRPEENSLGGLKMYQVDTSETVKCVGSNS